MLTRRRSYGMWSHNLLEWENFHCLFFLFRFHFLEWKHWVDIANFDIIVCNKRFSYLNILIWVINFIMKSITRTFIISNTIIEYEITSFANISIPFLRSCSQHSWTWSEHDLRKEIEILAKLVFSLPILVFTLLMLLVMLAFHTLSCCVCVCVYILSPWRLLPSARCPRHTWGYGSTILYCEY